MLWAWWVYKYCCWVYKYCCWVYKYCPGIIIFLITILEQYSHSHHQVTLHLVTIQHRHWNWSDWSCHGPTILSQSWDIIDCEFNFCVALLPDWTAVKSGRVHTYVKCARIRLMFSTAKLREQSNGNSQFEAKVQWESASWLLKIARFKILPCALCANYWQLHHQLQVGPDHPQIASSGPVQATLDYFTDPLPNEWANLPLFTLYPICLHTTWASWLSKLHTVPQTPLMQSSTLPALSTVPLIKRTVPLVQLWTAVQWICYLVVHLFLSSWKLLTL